ncbi:YqzL family protein [Paenibacillus septentrionalis]|uniref:YqzL family protein n=1 Tax=Paenibacillus septentrionalis TaxID=429342 RepID=A0ABW1V483_9BACL
MKDFSWKYFALTGDVESYLLYKEVERNRDSIDTEAIGMGDDEEELPIEGIEL